MQIAEIAKSVNIPLVTSDKIDTVFDGADQIDSHGYLIKGGGGALLRENILASSAICIDVGTPYTVMLFFLQCLPKARTNAVAALPLPRPSI